MKKLTLEYWKMSAELMFADDMAVLTQSENLQHDVNIIKRELLKKNMQINIRKTKSMIISNNNKTHQIT